MSELGLNADVQSNIAVGVAPTRRPMAETKRLVRGKMNSLVLGVGLLADASDHMNGADLERLLAQFTDWSAKVDSQNKAAKVYR